jgi:hypothetical protein
MSLGSFRLAEMHWIIKPISVCFYSFFSYFSAFLETWLGIVEALPVPNPTQQQRAVASGGLVYDHISLKVVRTELANKREAILKNWIQMARYLYYSF